MIKRKEDFAIYLQYRRTNPKTVSESTTITKVDILSSVKRYNITCGPENPIRYLEMELDRQTVADKYPDIIDNIVEGETRLIIDAVGSGTFIISKIWLEDNIYEIVALGSEQVIRGTYFTEGHTNTAPSSLARSVMNVWKYTVDWDVNDPYDPMIYQPAQYSTNPISVYNDNLPIALGLQLCAVADDSYVFFADKFVPSRILCSFDESIKEKILLDDGYYINLDYTTPLSEERIERQMCYKVAEIDDENHTCILESTDNSDFNDIGETIKDYLQSEYGVDIYVYRLTDTDKPESERVKVKYESTTVYAHYQDCMYYIRYKDFQSVNPDDAYPDRDGEINLYTDLNDYNRMYSEFDIRLFENVSNISSQNADASSTVINRQEMYYWNTNTDKSDVTINTNGEYLSGNAENPYYTGGVASIATYGIREGTVLVNIFLMCNPTLPGPSAITSICNNMVRRYKDPSQSITFTVNESKTDEWGYVGWERFFEPLSYANKINDHIHKIYLTNEHRCDGVEDKSLLRLSTYTHRYPEMSTTYTFGSVRESGLSQMIADLNQRTG